MQEVFCVARDSKTHGFWMVSTRCMPSWGGGRSLFTLESYADCLMTSGAIQKGVPTNVCRLLVVLVSCPATPKSASFTSPDSDNSTLAAARSKQNGERKRTKLASDLVSARQKHHYSDVRKPADKTSFLALAPRRQMWKQRNCKNDPQNVSAKNEFLNALPPENCFQIIPSQSRCWCHKRGTEPNATWCECSWAEVCFIQFSLQMKKQH